MIWAALTCISIMCVGGGEKCVCVYACVHPCVQVVLARTRVSVLLLALQFEVVYCDDAQLLQCAEQSALL